jgi:zinc protease
LVYLKFMAPRKDDNAFKATVNQIRNKIKGRLAMPTAAMMDTIYTVVSSGHPRNIIPDMKMVDAINQDKALEIYKSLYLPKSDFTYVIVGSVDPKDEAFQKMICTYIGGLPSKSLNEKYIDYKVRVPKGKVNKYFAKEMIVSKASNFIGYSAVLPYTLQNKVTLQAIANILDIRYVESIREKEGGSYGVHVSSQLDKYPVELAKLIMFFETDPQKQSKLMPIIHAEIAEIVKNGPRKDDLQKVKENLLKQYAQDLEENKWWQNTIVTYCRDGINLSTEYKAAVEKLTPELIEKTLEDIVSQGNVIEVVMTTKK